MNTIAYLKERYGCGVPIFLKDIRIGGKSKTAIKQALYRASKNGEIQKEKDGVYFFYDKSKERGLLFEEILEKRFIKNDEGILPEVYGYYSGLTFLNRMHLSEQVPAVLEITTNKTSSKKYVYSMGREMAFIRKPKAEITWRNWKVLQFLDMFSFLSLEEVKKNKSLIVEYAKSSLPKGTAVEYLKFYPLQTTKKIVEGGIIDAL